MLTLLDTESGAVVVLALSVDCFPQPGANHLKATKCPTRDTHSLVRYLYISFIPTTHHADIFNNWKETDQTNTPNQSSLSNQGGKLKTVSLTRVSLQKLPGSFFFSFFFDRYLC